MAGGKHRKTTTTGRLLDIALNEGGRYAKRSFHARVARAGYGEEDLKAAVQREGIAKLFAAAVLARIAARSVPGALVAAGAVIGKALWDRRNSAEAVDDEAS